MRRKFLQRSARRLAVGLQIVFSVYDLMTDAANAGGFCGSQIEMEILPSKTGSEFSHSLGH
jgi:hypothetical protein